MIPNLTKSLFAIFASSGEGAVDKDDLVSKLFPTNPWDVVIQISAFVILLLIVFFIAYKPVRKLLQRRSEYVEGQITSAEEAISELSQGMLLKAGTIIATGTPGGVAMGMKPPVYLKKGDVIRCEIQGIGSLVNKVG